MAFSFKYASPLRNTVLTIGCALLLKGVWHLVFGAPHSDFMSIKGFSICLMLGWAIVDIFFPDTPVPAALPKETPVPEAEEIPL